MFSSQYAWIKAIIFIVVFNGIIIDENNCFHHNMHCIYHGLKIEREEYKSEIIKLTKIHELECMIYNDEIQELKEYIESIQNPEEKEESNLNSQTHFMRSTEIRQNHEYQQNQMKSYENEKQFDQ